jgi:hypothetical protein
LLVMKRFPDLVLLSIGHNNVDWAWRSPTSDLEQPESRLQRQSRDLRNNFTQQMRRLIDRAGVQRYRVAVMVYGLIQFRVLFHRPRNRRTSAKPGPITLPAP